MREFAAVGIDALHASDLPQGNRTSNEDLISLALAEGRIVATKDEDFVATFWLKRRPEKLLLISTGNISNDELWRIFLANLAALQDALGKFAFVELSRTALTVHA